MKSELQSISALGNAVQDSIAQINENAVRPTPAESNRIAISETQAEILRLLAEGYTNAAIAVRRGTSLRATEALVQRTFSTLGLKNDEDFNPRVLAVRMWQEDKVVIR